MRKADIGLNALAIFAILFLLGFGFVVYAVPGAVASATAETDTSGSPPPTATAIGDGLSFALVPLPVYLHQLPPANYSFKEGGALVVVSGDKLSVTTSFIGAPNTAFSNVLSTGDRNITVGSVASGPGGGATFKGSIKLDPGTYRIGILIFVGGQVGGNLVAVSSPEAIQVVLGGQSSNTTSTTSSSNSSSTSTTYTAPPSQSSEPGQSESLEFVPVTTASAPRDYDYGSGRGGYAVSGGTLTVSLAFTGQQPDTPYSLVLSVNGTAQNLATYATNAEGAGSVASSVSLGAGSFVLGLTVVDATSFSAPTTVLTSEPRSFTVDLSGSSSTTTTSGPRSQTVTASSTSLWDFALKPVTAAAAGSAYRYATSGTAVVSLAPQYSLLEVVLGFQGANPSTQYSADLTLNGTTVAVGTMTTDRTGGALLHASVQVSPGRYQLGVQVYDVSTFRAGPVLVLVGDPATQLAVVSQPASVTTTSSSTTASTNAQATTIIQASAVETQIKDAVTSLTIPATVQVTPLSSTTTVLDPSFSLSVGQQAGNGLVIAISGDNVTGPRVLLINMTKTSPLALYPALNVTLDGAQVAQASSVLQVLNPVSTNPPYYVLVATANSIQLLVSIPHFSLHLIQVAGIIVHSVETSLELNAPLLAGSILVITLAFAGAYAARRRYFAVLL